MAISESFIKTELFRLSASDVPEIEMVHKDTYRDLLLELAALRHWRDEQGKKKAKLRQDGSRLRQESRRTEDNT